MKIEEMYHAVSDKNFLNTKAERHEVVIAVGKYRVATITAGYYRVATIA